MIIAPHTREVVTLFREESGTRMMIYDNVHYKLKFLDEISLEKFPINKIQLNSAGEILYGFGAYSLRAWKYHS